MENRNRIEVADKEDRSVLAAILVKNEYSVRLVKERPANRTNYKYFIEFWKEGESK